MRSANELVQLFNDLFIGTYGTELVAGGEEPIYLPATKEDELHRIVFTRDYFSSALHEISHWCIAGVERRRRVDFGYWYEPDGRCLDQQRAFEGVEVKPQALECIFSVAAGINFRVSVDNLNISEYDSSVFTEKVRLQVARYLRSGLPLRAQQFAESLVEFYRQQQAFAGFCEEMANGDDTEAGGLKPAQLLLSTADA